MLFKQTYRIIRLVIEFRAVMIDVRCKVLSNLEFTQAGTVLVRT